MNPKLLQNIEQLISIKKHVAIKLAKINLNSINDLLFHFPLRYQNRSHLYPIEGLSQNKAVFVQGVIDSKQLIYKPRKQLICAIKDLKTLKVLYLRFFNFQYLQHLLIEGATIRCFGEVKTSYKGFEMIHPEFEVFKYTPPPLSEYLIAVYPTTAGLEQYTIRKLVKSSLQLLKQQEIVELLPAEVVNKFNNINVKEALIYIHQPPVDANVELLINGESLAQKRLAFEELLSFHLSQMAQNNKLFEQLKAPSFTEKALLADKFIQQLEFKLTDSQLKVWQEILSDLQQDKPMSRLLQGGVGAGKTVVAILAMLQAIQHNYQVAFMAPTEILGEQHLNTIKKYLNHFSIKVLWMSGSTKSAERKKTKQSLQSDNCCCVIGTHALFQESIDFKNLGLVIIDEQHRFGVHQRLNLRNKAKSGITAHQLIMTATPIPRTLAMCLYAGLSHSIIDKLPPNRTPIKTAVLVADKRSQVIERVKEICKKQQQVFWVCPLIEESEKLNCQAAETTFTDLKEKLKNLNCGLAHGRLSAQDKQLVMQDFRDNKIQVLVATTVVEVGMDIPNASLIVIEDAHRLGLAQIHQLRGRVGRGKIAGYCVLLYKKPLSKIACNRLQIVRSYTDGFKIAEQDLKIRGPGEFLGTKQSGTVNFKTTDFLQGQQIIEQSNELVTYMVDKHNDKVSYLIERWFPDYKNYLS